MSTQIIKNFKGKVLIIGPTYNKQDKINNALNLKNNYDYLIFIGKLNIKDDKILYCLTNNEVKSNIYELKNTPNIIKIEFYRYSLVVTNGGIYNNMDLNDNIESSFIANINNKPWHENYDGRSGYVISSFPLTDKEPSFYKYSMRIGNSESGEVYAQEVDSTGLKQTIIL